MTEREVYKELETVFRDVFDDDTISLRPEMTANDIPGWDSQAHVSLIVAAESHFKVRFRTAELDAMHDVASLVRLVCAKQAAG